MTIQAPVDIQSPLSLQQFIKLVQELPASKIPELPIEKLPTNIPADISEKIPVSSKDAVNDLIMAVNSFYLKRRIRDQDLYGKCAMEALDKAKPSAEYANLRVFKNKILLLVEILQSAQQGKKKFGDDTFVKHITAINSLLIDVRSEIISFRECLNALQKTEPKNAEDNKRFDDAVLTFKSEIQHVEKTLVEYYVLRLKIFARIIQQKRKLVEAREKTIQFKKQELDRLQRDLEKTQALWGHKMSSKKPKPADETKDIQQHIYNLVNEIKSSEGFISESDLILWLDAIIEASLDRSSKFRVTNALSQARISLFYLLNKFCAYQEASAIQIAKNPLMQVDPEKAINFVLMSEQFILNYFTKKKNSATAWLSGAAENKMVELDQLQKEILTELRKTGKSMFKL